MTQEENTLQPYAAWSWKLRFGLIGSLLASIATIGIVAAFAVHEKSSPSKDLEAIGFRGLNREIQSRLNPTFVDNDNDLLADAPLDAELLVTPKELVLAHYHGDDEGLLRVDWEKLRQHLAATLGLPVKLRTYLHTEQDKQAVAAGEFQLVAAHSAEIPSLVNEAGLVPFAELGTEKATDGNRVVIAVSPKNTAKSLRDLRGSVLVCTEPDSVTGFRAAIVAIAMNTGMQPEIDYQIYFSHKHERSVQGLAIGKFPFVAISHDVLQRMLVDQRVEQSDFRILFESEAIPRLTIGYSHRLDQQLGSKIKKAVLDFDNSSTASEESDQVYRFIPTDYKQCYEFERRLDDAFEPRFGPIFEIAHQ